jgi:hypothetical protein
MEVVEQVVSCLDNVVRDAPRHVQGSEVNGAENVRRDAQPMMQCLIFKYQRITTVTLCVMVVLQLLYMLLTSFVGGDSVKVLLGDLMSCIKNATITAEDLRRQLREDRNA